MYTMKKIAYLIIASTISLTATYAQTSQSANNANTEQQADQEKTTVTLKVSGVTCNSDLKTLADRVKTYNGVLNCETVGKRGVKTKFKIDYNPAVITEKEIRMAFESTPGCSDPNDLPYKVK